MQIIKEQLGRINHFLIIMIPLFVVNAMFNLKYDWGGVSAIARIYITVLAFYLIFLFSQINSDDYHADYKKRYGRPGKYYLFFVLKIFPFVFIYFLMAIFTLINYLDASNWPFEPVYRLLDGRYSNTIFYSLILFVILQKKKRPGISIPLFIICSIIYFKADQILYALFEPGPGVSIIKLTKYIVFIFILVYGYIRNRWAILESAVISLFTGFFIYSLITSIVIISFLMSKPGSASLSISGRILLKSGFTFPLDDLQRSILEYGTQTEKQSIFNYIERYGSKTDYTPEELEKFISGNKIENIEYIFKYLNKRNIKINFEMLKKYTLFQIVVGQPDLSSLKEFKIHFASYYDDHKKEFYEIYNTDNTLVKVLVLNCLSYTKDNDAINFLINKITSVERKESDAAYGSLKKISGEDPASILHKDKYDIDVILFFRDYASKIKK